MLVNLPNAASLNLSLTVDAAGNLFGTTSAGGADGLGSVFEIASGSGVMTTLLDFNGTNGATPLAGLTADAFGNLLGTTSAGGANNLGTVFEVTGSGYVTPLCFAAGTRIAVPGGTALVETLQAGDLVLTLSGQALPVRWLGVQTIATRFADPVRVLPVRIRAGALADGLPVRDLIVSPGHALLIDGVLIQAGALIGGTSIVRDTVEAGVFCYYHVELDTHEILLAEGVAAESFLAVVETMAFDNRHEREAGAPCEELPYPRAKAARQVPAAIRQRLTDRAAALCGCLRAA